MKKAMGFLSMACCIPAVLAVGGCVSATFIPTGTVYPARAQDCEIEVFSAGVPDREFDEIGILEGEGSFWKADMKDIIPKLMEEACLAGGDALILQSAQKFASGEELDENMYAFATVIRWRRE